VSKVPGQTIIPGIGTFDIPLSPFPTILELGMAPVGGCFNIKRLVPCNCDALDYYLQAVSLNPLDMTFEISNPALITVKTLRQGWDGDGINDFCDPDCDGDGIPNDCDEICEKPQKACDDGCWKLFNKPLSSGGPVGDYGFRLDGLFGDHSDNMHTGATCKDGKLRVKKDGGTGAGSFTWMNTGEVIPLGPKADGDGIYAYIDTDLLFHAWVSFPGIKATAVGITSCP
jgi:hypothetical protein